MFSWGFSEKSVRKILDYTNSGRIMLETSGKSYYTNEFMILRVLLICKREDSHFTLSSNSLYYESFSSLKSNLPFSVMETIDIQKHPQ